MKLEGVHIFQAETIRRAAKIPTELRYRVEVRLLRRRRQITDRHVLDHAAAKRADLSHWKTSCLKGWASKNPRSSQTGGDYGDRSLTAALAASFNQDCAFVLLNQCCSDTPLKILFQQHRSDSVIRRRRLNVRFAGKRTRLRDLRVRALATAPPLRSVARPRP